jgi:hypothetical protein
MSEFPENEPGFLENECKGPIGKIQQYFNAGESCHQLGIDEVFEYKPENMEKILGHFFEKNEIILMYEKIKEKQSLTAKIQTPLTSLKITLTKFIIKTVYYYLENEKQKYWAHKELGDMFGGILRRIRNRTTEAIDEVFKQKGLCPYMTNKEIGEYLNISINKKQGPNTPPSPPKGGKRHKIVKKNRTLRKRKRKKKIQTKFKTTNKIISKRRGTINKKRRRTIKNKTKKLINK